MGVSLSVVTPKGTIVSLRADSDEVRIGRAPDCDVRLPYPEISAHHLLLSRDKDGWTVADLDSTNGTVFGGVPLLGARRLSNGDSLTLGRCELRVSFEPTETTAAFTLTDSGGVLRKLVLEGLDSGGELATLVGEDGTKVEIPNFAADVRPDGESFRIDRDDDGFRVVPGSDPVTINGQALSASGSRLNEGDVLAAQHRWVFHDPLAAHIAEVAAASDEKPPHVIDGGGEVRQPDWLIGLAVAAALGAVVLTAWALS